MFSLIGVTAYLLFLASGSSPLPAQERPATVTSEHRRAAAPPVPTATFYVAPNGNDAWSGKLASPNASNTDGPFATFDHARAQVQAFNKANLSRVNILFRAGTYYLPATVHFSAADSGTPNLRIVYQNYPGESPVISGGVPVLNWTNAGGNTWKTTLPASTQYFESLFYNGARRLRPRLGSGTLGTYFRIAATVYLSAPGPPAGAPHPNCSISVARSGWECFDRFQYNPADPIASTWKNLAPPAGNPCSQPAGNPALTGDIELMDFQKYAVSMLRVNCVDTTSYIVYLTGSTSANAGLSDALGFLPKHRYLVENIRDQLTQPGQWFLDRSTTPWTLTYLANPGENPNSDTVIVPQVSQLVIASNLQWVTFQGLTFAHDNYTVPAAGHNDSDLQQDVPGALSFQSSQHITFEAGIVAHTTAPAIEFVSCVGSKPPSWCVSTSAAAVTANNTVENSAFYDLGTISVRVGMPGQSSDTDANLPQFTTVRNNVVEGFGRVFPNSMGIAQGEGHDNLYTHNDVFDGFHQAIGICLCAGRPSDSHDNVISFNHAYNLMQGITNDGGSLYMQLGNTAVASPHRNKILNNKVHDVSDASAMDDDGYGGDGLYVDNTSGGVDVENNLVYRVSGSTMNFAEAPGVPSQPSIIGNNIFAFGRVSLLDVANPYWNGSVPPSVIQVFAATGNLFLFDRSTTSTPAFHVQGGCQYSGAFPYVAWQAWNGNLYWRTDGIFASDPQAFRVQMSAGTNNPCYGVKLTFLTFGGWQTTGEDVLSVVRNPGFKNPAYPADDYSLPNGPPIPGFVVFDPNQAGRSSPVLNPPPVPLTFPTKPFNPFTDY